MLRQFRLSSFSSPRVLAEIWGFTPNGGAKYKVCSNFRPICGYISETVHPIHSMFGSRLWFSGSADRMVLGLFAVR